MSVKEYRSSHLDAQCPAQFESHYTHGHGHLYWNHFERPYLEKLLRGLGENVLDAIWISRAGRVASWSWRARISSRRLVSTSRRQC